MSSCLCVESVSQYTITFPISFRDAFLCIQVVKKSIRSMPTGGLERGLLNLYFVYTHKFIAFVTVFCAAAKTGVKSMRAKTTVKGTQPLAPEIPVTQSGIVKAS